MDDLLLLSAAAAAAKVERMNCPGSDLVPIEGRGRTSIAALVVSNSCLIALEFEI